MFKILVVTPVKPGTILAPYTLGLPRIVSEMAPVNANREVSININRAKLQYTVRNSRACSDYTHVLLLDSDVVVSAECIEKLCTAWKDGSTACALTKEKKGGHVISSCGLLSMEDYLSIDYFDKMAECQCTKVPSPFYVEGAVGSED